MALRMCGTGEVIGMIRVKVFLEMFLFGENKSEGGLCTILLMNYGFCLSNCVTKLILGLICMGS